MRLILTAGWAIYPIGYFLGYLGGGTDANTVNIIYNVADLVNKTAFGLAIWAGAKDGFRRFIIFLKHAITKKTP